MICITAYSPVLMEKIRSTDMITLKESRKATISY